MTDSTIVNENQDLFFLICILFIFYMTMEGFNMDCMVDTDLGDLVNSFQLVLSEWKTSLCFIR